MFKADIYQQRRRALKQKLQSGLLLFLGNQESPMNYADNPYRFRQDSTFLYYWGLDLPGLAAIIDLDNDSEIIFGNDKTIDEIVWIGQQPTIQEQSELVGVKQILPFSKLTEVLKTALEKQQNVHFLPQYRAENKIFLKETLNLSYFPGFEQASVNFIKAVVAQRSVKSKEEIEEIEKALDISYEMHTCAMQKTAPGVIEQEIAGAIEGIALAHGGYVAYPVIFSINGQTLHNHYHGNVMQSGDIAVNDSGAASASHYASDITRTIPVSGKFTTKQAEIYNLVLEAMDKSIAMVRPGVKFKDVHLFACKYLATGLKELRLMKGDLDEAVEQGAHALFFQCGVGHMMGLDVHDMEDLGEMYVGYDESTKRSQQFGLKSLRLAKQVEEGFVVTVEPGIYLIPELIDMWKTENKFANFINYDAVEKYRDFGGIRVEENVFVTTNSYKILGKPIPKTIEDVEKTCAG